MNNSEKLRGLSQEEAFQKLKSLGTNEIPEKEISFLKKFVDSLKSPVSLMLLLGVFLLLWVGKLGNAFFVVLLVLFNFAVTFWQENKADKAVKKIQGSLNISVKVLRDGKWRQAEAKFLVPGDVIELVAGNIIPADIKIIEAKNANIDESVLTGESLFKEKESGDFVYSGSFLMTGWMTAEIRVTGKNTHFGKIIDLAEEKTRQSLLELDILSISLFLSIISLVAVVVLTLVLFWRGFSVADVVAFDLGLLVNGIPISLAATMSIIISKGVIDLAKKNVVVRRLSSLEELANINLFLMDKTGTLTKNKIRVEKIIAYGGYKEEEVVAFAASAEIDNNHNHNPIDSAIIEKAREMKLKLLKSFDFIPADSERKRSSSTLAAGDEKITVCVGASQVIGKLCRVDDNMEKRHEKDIEEASKNGYRALSVSVNRRGSGEKNMDLAGVLLLSDTLNEDVKETMDFIKINGIRVKILTGDSKVASDKIARMLEFEGETITRETLEKREWNLPKEEFDSISVFSEIFPSDKYKLVQFADNNGFHVAVTGDGINDLPAIKIANVGIAVKNAADALKSSADIVLTEEGISPIIVSVNEAKKILARLYFYSVYRVSEGMRIVFVAAVLGLAYSAYPMTSVQLFLLSALNSIPILSMAFNRVKISSRPARINFRECFFRGSVFSLLGVLNSLVLFLIMQKLGGADWPIMQTALFFNFVISGHMLIYVVHTEEKWFKFLPGREVVFATILSGFLAAIIAIGGIFVEPVSLKLALAIWLWSFLWMQIADNAKIMQRIIIEKYGKFFNLPQANQVLD